MNLADGIKDKMDLMGVRGIKDLTEETDMMTEGLSITPRATGTMVTGIVARMILGITTREVTMNTTKVKAVGSTSSFMMEEVRALEEVKIKDQSTPMKVTPIITVIALTIKAGFRMILDLKAHIQMQADMIPKSISN